MSLNNLTIFFLLSIIPVTIQAAPPSLFNESSIKNQFWSPLTEVEIAALKKTPLAKSGDPEALLELAILASGDSRTQEAFNRIKKTVEQFVQHLKPQLSAEKNTWRKGYLLYSAMHKIFFSSQSVANELKNYRAEQSQFTQIFEDQTFNCVSSSLLYLILARYFGLTVEGVILPSHTFVQLTTPQGQVIEIETTSLSGFGIRHNEQFYQQEGLAWSRQRKLSRLHHEDYLNREIVSIFQFITDNMNHQHTAPDRLVRSDRYRLSEIRAWLLPESSQAQQNRLYVYNNELIRLMKNSDHQSAQTLLNIAEEALKYYKQLAQSDQIPDDSIAAILTFMLTSKAEIALEKKEYRQAIENYRQALTWARDASTKIRLQQNIAIVRLNQGNGYFAQQQYPMAIRYYAQAHSQSQHSDTSLTRTINNNIASAYWNMAIPHLNAGDSYSAYDLLRQCRKRFPKVGQCQEKMDSICQSYSLPDCQ